MPKTAIKQAAIEDNRILGEGLTVIDGDLSLLDAHRKTPRAQGGEYTPDNTVVGTPEDHMRLHNIWRDREPTLANLKALIDDRNQTMKLGLKVNNQLLAFKRGVDAPNSETVAWLEKAAALFKGEMVERDKLLAKFMTRYKKESPLARAALGVKGVGPVAVSYCLVYIDLAKSRHASSVWKYAGLHTASHERYKAGEAGGGNRTLRTVLYTMADAQMKHRNRGSGYGYLYDQVKSRLEISNKLTKTRMAGTKGQAPQEVAWKDTKPSHRHGAALRAIMKHFLADYWYVGRELAGLDTGPAYAEAMLGNTHKTIDPRSRGWEW